MALSHGNILWPDAIYAIRTAYGFEIHGHSEGIFDVEQRKNGALYVRGQFGVERGVIAGDLVEAQRIRNAIADLSN